MIRVSHIGHSNFVYISLLYPNKVQFLFPHKQKKKQWLRKRTHPKTHKIYITHAHTIQHLVFIPIILEISKIFTSSTLALFFSRDHPHEPTYNVEPTARGFQVKGYISSLNVFVQSPFPAQSRIPKTDPLVIYHILHQHTHSLQKV